MLKKINTKAFTLVEIVVAVALLSVSAIGIGAMLVGARNNSEKQLNESELQQQLVEVQESLKSDILATNAGVKYWVKNASGSYVPTDADTNTHQDKLLAMYTFNYMDSTVVKTYVQYDSSKDLLYKAQVVEPIVRDENNRITIDESPTDVMAAAGDTWDVYAQEVTEFGLDLSKYELNKTVNYNVNVANDDTNYNSDNTLNIRNDISINSAVGGDVPPDAVVPKPILANSRFEYNGQERTPKETNFNSRYVERTPSSITSATNAGTYEITYVLKNPESTWEDGTNGPITLTWVIVKRPVTVVWGQTSWIYDYQVHSTTATLGNIVPADEATVKPNLLNNQVGPNVGTQTVTLTLTDDTNYEVRPEDATVEISITRGPAMVDTHPTPKDLTYTGEAQVLINPGTSNTGTLKYALTYDGPYSTELPTGIDSNNEKPYVIFYYVEGDAQHEDSEIQYIEAIIKRADPMITPPQPIPNLGYNGEAQVLITPGIANNGNLPLYYSCDDGEFSQDLPTGIIAGEYTIVYKTYETPNYKESEPGTVIGKILKAEQGIEMPKGVEGLVYNGNEQELIIPSTPKQGQWEYKVDNGEWSTEIPAKILAKDAYEVWYRLPETEDYREIIATEPLRVKIDKAPAQFTPPRPIAGLVYNATEQTLIHAGITNDGTFYYGYNNVIADMKQELPAQTKAGYYDIYYYVKGDNNHYDSEVGMITAVIDKLTASTALPPIGVTAVYTGNPIELLSFAGQPEGNQGAMVFAVVKEGETLPEDAVFAVEIPTKIDAAKYDVYYMVLGNDDYYNSPISEVPIRAEIKQATNAIVDPKGKTGLVYNGTAQTLIIGGSAKFGTMEYSLDNTTWSTELPTAINAGDHTVYYRVEETPNWTGKTGSLIVNIEQAPVNITKHPSGVTVEYNGSEHILIDQAANKQPVSDVGTFVYRVQGETSWSETPPKRTETDTYIIEYKVDAGPNYKEVVHNVTSYITKTTNSVNPAPSAKTLTFNGSAQELVNLGTAKYGAIQYSLDGQNWLNNASPKGTNAGNYKVYWKVPGTRNYDEISGSVDVTIAKLGLDTPVINPVAYTWTGNRIYPTMIYADEWITPSGDLFGIDAGSYSITFKLNDSANTKWNDVTKTSDSITLSWRIDPARMPVPGSPEITWPQGQVLIYNGAPQALLSQMGSYTYGTFYYRIKTTGTPNPWILGNPTGTDIGTYIIEYYIQGDENHYDSDIYEVTSRITGGEIDYEAPDVQVEYDGNNHTINVSVYTPSGCTVTYRAESATAYSATKPSYKHVGSYKIYFKIVDPTGDYDTVEDYATLTITPLPPPDIDISTSLSWPSNINKEYTGSAQALATGGSAPEGYWFEYSLEGGTYSKTVPTGINVADYTIDIRLVGDANHTQYDENGNIISYRYHPITSHITPANPTFTAPTASNKVYNGALQTIQTAGSSNHGTFVYSITPYDIDTNDLPTTDDLIINAGYFDANGLLQEDHADTYTIYWRLVGDANHKDYPYDKNWASFTATIAKATPEYQTRPTAKTLTYNGSAQQLVTAADIKAVADAKTACKIQYSTDNSNWSTSIPTGTNAGNYTVYYKIVGNSDWNNVAAKSISVTIAKANPTVTLYPASNLKYSGSAQKLLTKAATSTSGGTISYKVGSTAVASWDKATGTDAGAYTVTATVAATTNYNSGSDSVIVTIGQIPVSSTQKPTVSGKTWTYNGSSYSVTTSGTGWTFKFSTDGGSTWSTTKPSRTNAGTTTVNWKATHKNYTEETGTATLKCNKADAYWSSEPDGGTYDYTGSSISLGTKGTAVGGTGYYKLSGGSYSTSRPKATNVGTYTVYYYIEGDANHNSTSADYYYCEIESAMYYEGGYFYCESDHYSFSTAVKAAGLGWGQGPESGRERGTHYEEIWALWLSESGDSTQYDWGTEVDRAPVHKYTSILHNGENRVGANRPCINHGDYSGYCFGWGYLNGRDYCWPA